MSFPQALLAIPAVQRNYHNCSTFSAAYPSCRYPNRHYMCFCGITLVKRWVKGSSFIYCRYFSHSSFLFLCIYLWNHDKCKVQASGFFSIWSVSFPFTWTHLVAETSCSDSNLPHSCGFLIFCCFNFQLPLLANRACFNKSRISSSTTGNLTYYSHNSLFLHHTLSVLFNTKNKITSFKFPMWL